MNIITALADEKINEKIKEKSNFNIICKDIQYQEALLEILEKNNNIDLLILSSILPGELDIYELINIIKYKKPKINIFIILEKQNENIENFLIKKGINNIFFNNEITVQELIKKIENKNINIIEKKENIIINKNKKTKKFFSKIIKKINIKKTKTEKKEQEKIITIIGPPKIGKSIFAILLCLNIVNKKILLVEFNFNKSDIKTILGKKQSEEITKYKENIDLLHISENKKELEYILNKYDYIFFDIGNIEDGKEILLKSNKIILLIEPNLIGIKETSKILEKIINKWKIKKEKIKIVYNKTNIFSINNEILNQLFSDFQRIGILKNNNYYNFLINNNFKTSNLKINKEYKKIVKKIIN